MQIVSLVVKSLLIAKLTEACNTLKPQNVVHGTWLVQCKTVLCGKRIFNSSLRQNLLSSGIMQKNSAVMELNDGAL